MRRILLLALLVSPSAFAAYSNSTNTPPTPFGTTATVYSGFHPATFTNTATGSILWELICLPTGTVVTGFTDTAGNTWSIITGASDGTWQCNEVYTVNTTAYSGADQATITFTNGPSTLGFRAAYGELLGGPTSSVLAASSSATGTSATATTNLTGLSAGSAIVAYTVNLSAKDPTAGTGYTCTASGAGCDDTGVYGFGSEYNLSSASGTVAAYFTQTSATWNIIAMAFAPAGGATCTHSGYVQGTGAVTVPTAGTTSVWLHSGLWGTVDCSSTSYYQIPSGSFGVN